VTGFQAPLPLPVRAVRSKVFLCWNIRQIRQLKNQIPPRCDGYYLIKVFAPTYFASSVAEGYWSTFRYYCSCISPPRTNNRIRHCSENASFNPHWRSANNGWFRIDQTFFPLLSLHCLLNATAIVTEVCSSGKLANIRQIYINEVTGPTSP
jgi:hypothetical protein